MLLGCSKHKNLPLLFLHLPCLQLLDLRNAQLGDECFRVLADALPRLSASSKYLQLENNELSDGGIKSLSSILPQFALVKNFNLSFNRFGDEGLILLSSDLSQLTHLPQLLSLFKIIKTLFFRFLPPQLQLLLLPFPLQLSLVPCNGLIRPFSA